MLASSRTRSVGRSTRTNTAAAGSTAYATIASRSEWLSPSNIMIRSSIPTRHFRSSRRIRSSAKFSMAGSSSATARKELYAVRNFHQGFHGGLWSGLFQAGAQFVTGGRGFVDPMRGEAGYKEYTKLNRDRALVDQSSRFKGDGKLTFDRLTDVYHSGTRHEEDQPCHLVVLDPNICSDRCVREYGNPCQYFCPAAVYEMTLDQGEPKLKINASNCVHCKTCDIADPYQIINWVPPEGGGGPNYEGM